MGWLGWERWNEVWEWQGVDFTATLRHWRTSPKLQPVRSGCARLDPVTFDFEKVGDDDRRPVAERIRLSSLESLAFVLYRRRNIFAVFRNKRGRECTTRSEKNRHTSEMV